jgi:prephenate dehydrogenase
MFGPDSGKNGWHDLNFVYERTRIDAVILDQVKESKKNVLHPSVDKNEDVESFVEEGSGKIHSVHEHSEAHIEGMDRIERFLSIWEEEGCRMVSLSCRDHDMYAANSQFITHLMGRILGAQGLEPTPIDTKGFDSVLRVIDSTTADSFDLFYGLYKYNQNSMDTIMKLRDSMDDVVEQLSMMELNDK